MLRDIDGVEVKAKCGHKTKLIDEITYGPYTAKIVLYPAYNNSISFCHKCISKMTDICLWCGKPIFVGDEVAMWYQSESIFTSPEHAVRCYGQNLCIIGCLRQGCIAESYECPIIVGQLLPDENGTAFICVVEDDPVFH